MYKRFFLASLVIFLSLPMLAMKVSNGEDREQPIKKQRPAIDQDELDHRLWELSTTKNIDPALVQLLLDEGANPNAPFFPCGKTVFMEAAQRGSKAVCELLIKSGADVTAHDDEGYTALSYALCNREVYKLLLENGANPNTQNRVGVTSLMYVARYGTIDLIKLLLQFGANPDIKDNEGCTAHSFAERNRDIYPLLSDPEKICALLSDPKEIRTVVLDPNTQNPKMQKLFKSHSNIHQALLNRELGIK